MMQILYIVKRHIQLLSITDILDISITAFVIYKAILLIRSSRAAKVAKALFFFFLVLWVSTFLKLNVISFFLSRATELGLLALVVVFQPEIRRILEQVGSGSFSEILFGKISPSGSEVDIAITQTVAAYTALSKDKVGALMVFERKIPLDELLKTGTALNCETNAELLKNIFWNKAPLHDGAVIVRGGRIIGAGCVLPLSGNVNLSKELGMRHRAGIGMSESSDAIVAIVSEETGSISVAVNGTLKRHLAPETLERFLRSELMPEEDEPVVYKLNLLDRFKKKEAEK